MKWELDDNARSGFHYLLLGVLIIGLPSFLLWGFDTWHSAAESDGRLPLGVFHNGYLLLDGSSTTVADTSRAERLAFACAIAIGGAALLTAVLLVIRAGIAWCAGRWCFLIVFAWCACSALFFPRISATISPGTLTVSERTVIVGDITVPFTARTTVFPWQQTDELLGLSMPAPGISVAFRMAAFRVHGNDTLIFATTDARGRYFGLRATSTRADRALDCLDSLLFNR